MVILSLVKGICIDDRKEKGGRSRVSKHESGDIEITKFDFEMLVDKNANGSTSISAKRIFFPTMFCYLVI